MLGNTTAQTANNIMVPTRLGTDTQWVDLAVTYNLWVALKSDGTLWAWGRDAGALAGSAATNAEVPVQIGAAADWQTVSASGEDLLLRKRDGSWWLMQSAGVLLELQLPSNALAGGTTAGGVAVVTPGRVVWAWGTELGERPASVKFATFAESLLARCGWTVDLQPLNNRVVQTGHWMIRHRESKERSRSEP
jgi:hypothetical protein